MPQINDTPNTPGTIGYDDTKPATVSGSNPGIPVNDQARPDWAGGRQAYDIGNDTSVYRLTVHAAGETFTSATDGLRVHTITREDATALLRKLADMVERAG